MSDKPRGLLLVMMDVDPAHDGDFNRWYDLDHVPERLGCPGFLSARRFEAVEGEPKYLALYELESLDALETPTYLRHLAEPTEWTTAIHEHTSGILRNVYVERTIIRSDAPHA